MQKLKFVNGNGVKIDLTSGNYGITAINGLSNANLNLQTQQIPNNDGSVYIDSLLDNRIIDITVALNDDNNLEKRYRLRRELIFALNPKLGEGYLYYKNDFLEKRIKVIPNPPIIKNKNSNEKGTVKASVSFTACNVYWEDTVETYDTFKLGKRGYIENKGDIVCNVDLEIVTNQVKNPRIKNLTNGKQIKLIGDFDRNIHINTNTGNKTVYDEKHRFDVFGVITTLNSITYSSELNMFITVGYDGMILTSNDGINWTSRTSGITNALYSIIYISELNMFITVGDNERILTSNDGINWTSRTSGITNELYSITYSSELNMFITVGGGGRILTSNDGINWTSRTSGITNTLRSITYISELNMFITVGGGGRILTSNDGINWTSRTSGITDRLYSITYSSELNMFITVGSGGRILTSNDGINWTSRTSGITDLLYSITYSSELNMFITVGGGGRILTSNDGINWTSRTSGITSELRSITYSSEINMFITVGNSGRILTSNDGINWTNTDNLGGFFQSIIVKDRTIYAVGSLDVYSQVEDTENLIDKLSSDSNMNFNLEVGTNELLLIYDDGSAVASIKYRNKYLGV